MIRKLQSIIKEQMTANRNVFLFLSLAFVLGVSAGAFTVNGLSTMQRDELSNYLHGFLQLFGNQNVEGSELFSMGLAENLKVIGLLWVLGVTIIGIPFIFVIMGVKGFVTGFSSGFIINALGAKGILFSAFALLPKEIIIIPCLICIGVNGINFSMQIAKSKSIQETPKNGLKTSFISYCLVTLLFSCIAMAGVLFDAYVAPVLIRMLIPSLTF